jgi:hypothetical protein
MALRPEQTPEQELNARLRRADWRFLLPSPRPRRVLCRADGTLAAAVASIADEVFGDGQPRDCDLAVAQDPDSKTLAELREALGPGGTCYTEWYPGIGGASRVEASLRAAGFEDVTCFRPWPAGVALPVYWIPLGAPGAAAYVRLRRRLRGGRVRRLLAAIRRRAAGLLRGRIDAPICAIARRSATPLTDASGPVAWLREGWPAWGIGPAPERISTLLVTGGPRSVSKVVLLAFAEPSPLPRVAVKAPRVDDAADGVRREGAVLAGLTARRQGSVSGVPRILVRREIDGLPMVGETALVGRPLESLLTSRSLDTWSTKVTDWLAGLVDRKTTFPAAQWRRVIAGPALSRFVDAFGGVVDEGLLRETESMVGAVGALPTTPEQRDFGPWNVLVTPPGEIAVLDWESAELDGLPALDLLYYLAYASFQVDGARTRDSRVASYRRSLDPSTRTGAIRRACLARYVDALGLDPVQLGPLRALVWLIHAESDFRHAAADAGGPPPAEVLARSLFRALWIEEIRHLARG